MKAALACGEAGGEKSTFVDGDSTGMSATTTNADEARLSTMARRTTASPTRPHS